VQLSPNPKLLLLTRCLLAGIAGLLLFWNLGRPYLWQDEAATAVLAQCMLRFGRPLAYDGKNLITIDHAVAEDSTDINQRTRDAQAAVDFYVQRGDFKSDTAWKWQPWGQFVFAACSLKVLGTSTLAARLPFAIAGVVTVWVLFEFVLAGFANYPAAVLASLFLITNSYWILHTRQCRYYALSSLFLTLTIAAYARWQRGVRGGAFYFVLSAWCWFQVDYGTLWPVVAVLALDALLAHGQEIWKPMLTCAALASAIAPFAYYYEIWGRRSVQSGSWIRRFEDNLFNLNEYVLPVLIVFAAIVFVFHSRHRLPPLELRLVGILISIPLALLAWVPSVAPAPFLRYLIAAAPVGAVLAAWTLVKIRQAGFRAAAWAAGVAYVVTPWLGLPLHALPIRQRDFTVIRPELKRMAVNVFGKPIDPNRPIIDWLKQKASPADQILINYEDVPLMFYLPNPIRGGISAFRAEDDAQRPPDFVVLRKSADFGHWNIYQREVQRYSWDPIAIRVADIRCGNCPDPAAQEYREPGYDPHVASSIFFARRAAPTGDR
jgi:hypothetical protein